jgi:tetratricopeptide (TPR) repeat protein
MDAMKVQAQIRKNSEEVSSYVSDMSRWEKDMTQRDKDLRSGKAKKSVRAPRAGSGTVKVTSAAPPAVKSESAANHTYDVGYKKWENYKEDEENSSSSSAAAENVNRYQTPASIIQTGIPETLPSAPVPRARGVANTADAETMERERGNEEFKKGNFREAVKQYTRCLGMKIDHYVAFSNRAMSYLKLKEYMKAEADCTCALRISPDHVKSLCRRATARNALGKHRAAVSDLLAAERLEPGGKTIKADLQKARELLRNAVNRAPLIEIATDGSAPAPDSGSDAADGRLQGPDMPSRGSAAAVHVEDTQDTAIGQHAAAAATNTAAAAATSTQTAVNTDKVAATVKPKTASTSTSKDKASATATGARKAVSSKPKAKAKANPTTTTGGGYDLERSLRMFRGQSAQMEAYLDTLALADVPQLMSNLMEGDVVAMLLLEMSNLHGTKRGNWDVVVAWFDKVSEVSSFNLLVSLITAADKEQLRLALERSVQVVAGDEEYLIAKVEILMAAYKL